MYVRVLIKVCIGFKHLHSLVILRYEMLLTLCAGISCIKLEGSPRLWWLLCEHASCPFHSNACRNVIKESKAKKRLKCILLWHRSS